MSYRSRLTPYHDVVTQQYADGTTGVADLSTGVSFDFVSSTNSPRIGRRLILRPNALTRVLDYENHGLSSIPNRFGSVKLAIRNLSYPDLTLVSLPEAASSFYAAVGEIKINVLQSFAERRQTMSLVASSATRIANAFLSLRRGDVSGVVKNLSNIKKASLGNTRNSVANQWLEIQYGWKPLLNDVYGAMIATVPNPPSFDITIKRSRSDPYNSHNLIYFNDEWFTDVQGLLTTSTCIKAKVVVDDPNSRSAANLGIDNPALLAWELVPYSFVVDWFFPIGNYLESWTALSGVKLVDQSTTMTKLFTYKQATKPNPLPQYGWPFAGVKGHEGSGTLMRKSRVLSAPSIPLPRFKNPLSVSHTLSALALLNNAFSSSKRIR